MTTKKIVMIGSCAAIIAFIPFILYQRKEPLTQKIYTTQEVTSVINDVYTDLSGFTIEEQERKFIEDAGGNATYGEIIPESVAQLMDYFKPTSTDVFFDLGSGIGKVCVQVALTTPAKAVGVELSSTRYAMAQQARQALIEKNILIIPSKLEFKNENILDADLSQGTIFFLCSTCFSDDLMSALTKKIANNGKKVQVATLRQLPDTGDFTLQKTFHLQMTWSDSSPVYIYKLVQ